MTPGKNGRSIRGNKMRRFLLLAGVAALTACSNSIEHGGYEIAGGSGTAAKSDDEIHTFTCPETPNDCIKLAKQQCGEAGYSRVRTPGHTGIHTGAHSMRSVNVGRSNSEIRRRADMATVDTSTMSVRCKTPKE